MNPAPHDLPAVRLLTWAAWAPEQTETDAWKRWARGEEKDGATGAVVAAAPCLDVPALMRRRCSTLTRMVLQVAFAACRQSGQPPQEVTTVYCSRYGEMSVLRSLLDNLSDRQPMSPTQFSNSVHHSATGYFGMASGNRLPSRTLSGGQANLVCGFLEALGMLQRWPARACLLMFADERLPEPFQSQPDQPPFPYAIGFMLGTPSGDLGTTLELRRALWSAGAEPAWAGVDPALDSSACLRATPTPGVSPSSQAVVQAPSHPSGASRGPQGDAVLDFLRWLECDEGTFSLPTQFGIWTWTK